MYFYIMTEPGLYTVGFYDPEYRFVPEGDYDTAKEACARVSYLNGGPPGSTLFDVNLGQQLQDLEKRVKNLEAQQSGQPSPEFQEYLKRREAWAQMVNANRRFTE